VWKSMFNHKVGVVFFEQEKLSPLFISIAFQTFSNLSMNKFNISTTVKDAWVESNSFLGLWHLMYIFQSRNNRWSILFPFKYNEYCKSIYFFIHFNEILITVCLLLQAVSIFIRVIHDFTSALQMIFPASK